MLHCFTLWLPEQYRRRGPDLLAVSVFQWNDELYFKDPLPEVVAADAGQPVETADPAHPFRTELARAVRHPQLQLADDGVDHLFAMIWLTHDELNGPRQERPTAAPELADGEHDIARIMRRYGLFGGLWLVPREDPNTGVPPLAFPEDGDAYVDVTDRYELFHDEHLGGTAMSPNGIRDGVSPWYLEIHRVGGVSHGGDEDLAIDLDGAFLGSLSSHVRIGVAEAF